MDSDRSSTNRSRQSSSSSVQLPIDMVPLRMETPTGINNDLSNDDEIGQIEDLAKHDVLPDDGDQPFYGKCAKCDEDIVGEYSAVKAMGKVYHKRCFVCVECKLELDNKPFYCVKEKVYCEQDYLVSR